MKKLIYFSAFVVFGYFASGNAYSQASLPGGGEDERWICCQILENLPCYDKYGLKYDHSERVEGVATCTISILLNN